MGFGLWAWGGATLYSAEPLTRAVLTEIHNEVVVLKESSQEKQAALQDVIQGQDVVKTGKKSRAELEFADKSIARLGSNTSFSFDSTGREMNLKRGSALFHVPPGLSGAKIRTPIATAAVLGDVVAMRVNELGDTQVLALSRDKLGPISVTFDRTGETCQLEPGQMLTLHPADFHMPVPTSVNVEIFLKTSMFVKKNSGFSSELPKSAQKEIQHAEDIQRKDIRLGVLQGAPVLNLNQDGNSPSNLNMVMVIANILVQSVATGSLSGQYSGAFNDGFANGYHGPVVFTVNRDNTITGTGVILNTGQSFSFHGTMNSTGIFQGLTSFGTSVNGKLNLGGANFTGTVVHNYPGTGLVNAGLSGSKI